MFVLRAPAMLLTDGTVSKSEAWFRAVWWQEGMHPSLSDLRVVCGSLTGVEKGSARVERWAQSIMREMCFHCCTTATWHGRIKIFVSK